MKSPVGIEHCKSYIRNRHKKGLDWGLIKYLASVPLNANLNYLSDQLADKVNDGWPELSMDEWFAIFEEQRQIIEKLENDEADLIEVSNKSNDSTVLENVLGDRNSCWNRYKYKLLNKAGFLEETVELLEFECSQIVRHLKPDTVNGAAMKGMVVGNVQSGKTANMAGVIAMAADLGYNFFVVLSGTITNLREQTAGRLYADLALIDGKVDDEMRLSWHVMHNLQPKCPVDQRLGSLKLAEMDAGVLNRNRYLNVCLKNKKRLRDLLGWMQAQDSVDKTGQLKILIIDDECDQAGVNTADIEDGEQTAIFKLIKGLCDHAAPSQHDSLRKGNKYKAVNYIAYSATPYANILNDANQDTSLFPTDFIFSLKLSPSYFGPSRYFSAQTTNDLYSFEDFPFINEITDSDLDSLRQLHTKAACELPVSLQESVRWFLCLGAVRRMSGTHEPVSMLVHTSNKTDDHETVASAIEKYLSSFKNADANTLAKLKRTYDEQKSRLTKETFWEMFPDYEPKKGEDVCDLPEFESIKDGLAAILKENVVHIKTTEDDLSTVHEFSGGIHLCVDNSCNNALVAGDDGSSYTMRIKYPSEGECKVCAPLFLVVGGNTLSRGLTLKGLICSYFVRTVRQGDSLMQMGRWFGYRFGYELMPRVWMSESTLAKFCLLNEVDLDLRGSLKAAMGIGLPPSEMVPCIIDTSSEINAFTVTSPRKMQFASIAQNDYSGQVSVISSYDTDDVLMQGNEDAVVKLLQKVGKFERAKEYAKSNFYNSSVGWDLIKELLVKYRTSSAGKTIQDFKLITDYVERQLGERNWTVIVSGNSCVGEQTTWHFGNGYEIGKVNRSASRADAGFVAFQHVTQPSDFVCDIEYAADCAPGTTPFNDGGKLVSVPYYRSHATENGKDKSPVLIIVRIDKEHLNKTPPKHGVPVSLNHDVFGLAFYFPGNSDGDAKRFTKLCVQNLVSDDEPENEA